MNCRRWTLLFIVGLLNASPFVVADELGDLVRQAVRKVDASIVRLRVIGGEQSIDGERVSSLVTTGVVISGDGNIITSQFALQGNPEAVLIEDSQGKKVNAKIIATDFVRRLVLLKANDGQWTAAPAANDESIQVGQYAIAAGRFYATDSSSVSVGVISALKRIHGMAIQTDAKVSPINYGGPLISLEGKVQGILVPLSPRAQSNSSSGVEWYDSGIGFAIPMQEALKIAERLKSGKDLKPGRLGMRMKTNGMFSTTVLADRVLKNGPADLAGIRRGDRLVTVNGRPLERIGVLEEAIASRYAGDIVTIDVKRGEESLSLKVELTDELPVPQRGEFGFLHVRVKSPQSESNNAGGVDLNQLLNGIPGLPAPNNSAQKKSNGSKDEQPGEAKSDSVAVAVLDNGAAAKAGLPSEVELIKIGNTQITSSARLFQASSELSVGEKIALEYRLPDSKEVLNADLELQPAPEQVPEFSASVLDAVSIIGGKELKRQAKMKAGEAASTEADAEKAKDEEKQAAEGVERKELKFEERGRAVVFSSSKTSGVAPGVVVLLSAHATAEEQILNQWKPFLASHHLIVAVPINPEGVALSSDDVPLILTTVNGIASGGRADLRRVVVVADRDQIQVATAAVFGGPSPIRGLALSTGWLSKNDFNGVDGNGSSVVYLESPKNNQAKLLMEKSREELRKLGFTSPIPSSSEHARSIANWSLGLRTF